MPYVLLVVATCALGLLIYVLTGCSPSNESPRQPTATTFDVPLSDKPLSRAELAARLERLAASPLPTELAPGAMCYVPALLMPPDAYVCPTCGERTFYSRPVGSGGVGAGDTESAYRILELGIENYRQEVAKLASLSVALDESQFCRKCSPDVQDPKLVLVTKPPGAASAHRTVGVTSRDLVLLRRFAEGLNHHDYDRDGESPLKDYLPRIRELLGIPADSTEQK